MLRGSRRRPPLALAALAILTLLGLAACSQPPAAAPAKPAAAGQPAGAPAAQAPASAGGAQPVEIRIGHGFAAEENLWLMTAKPELAPNQGRAYRLTFTAFRGNTDRLTAYEAGQIDGGTISPASALFAVEQGVPMKLVASVVREKPGSFNTTYLALDDSGIHSAADVRGKTIGIVDFKSATELWARAAIEAAGLNPDRDVSFVVVPFPAMGEQLRGKRIDVGAFPEPFVTVEKRKGGVAEVWTAKTGVPFDEELLDLFLQPDFIAKNRDAVRAFLADFVATTRWYLANLPEARQVLVDKKLVQIDPELYQATADYYHDPSGRITAEGLSQEQDLLLKLGWQRNKLNVADLVDSTLLP
jgi:ABC-type nitrate/sulfonate/bicarbonate transport system substrate-binding protein